MRLLSHTHRHTSTLNANAPKCKHAHMRMQPSPILAAVTRSAQPRNLTPTAPAHPPAPCPPPSAPASQRPPRPCRRRCRSHRCRGLPFHGCARAHGPPFHGQVCVPAPAPPSHPAAGACMQRVTRILFQSAGVPVPAFSHTTHTYGPAAPRTTASKTGHVTSYPRPMGPLRSPQMAQSAYP